ncbi:MAG: hypothetical protein AAGN64_14550, partial [Bacteroidota bacterium]
MAKPWIDSAKLDCQLDQSDLDLDESDVAALVAHTREMLDDLRSQAGGVDAELAEMIDAGTAGR